MEAKFKVGDKVVIAQRIGVSNNYRFGYADEMTQYAGQVATIIGVSKAHITPHHKVEPDDGYSYQINLDSPRYYSWASSMFESKYNNLTTFITNNKKKTYKLNWKV